jgi:serine/threonine protein kinase
MRAPPDPGSVSADKSGLVGPLPLALLTDFAIRSMPQDESEHDDSQSIDVALDREESGICDAAFVDNTPTAQLIPGPQQPAIPSGMRVQLAPGSVLRSRYVLEKVIGLGGTSILFRAKDLHRALSHDVAVNFVAIKLLRPELCADPRALSRLQREFQQMQGLSHPGIVRVFDLDCDGHVWFISMELVAGQTLKTWMEMPANHANALRIICACSEALEYAHSLGILHGDLKPTNVMVTNDGTVKIIDFGSAASPGTFPAARLDPALVATPLYASPQILAGKGAERGDDVYGLACLSYYVLSGGRHPFGGRPSLEEGRAKSAPTYTRAIPIGLFAVIERGLSAERERRPPSVRRFLADLTDAEQRYQADTSSGARAARDNANVACDSVLVMCAADGASRSMSLPFFRKALVRSPVLTKTKGTEVASSALVTIANRFGWRRGSYRRAQPFVRLIALVFSIIGAALFFRLGAHRNVIRAPESPPETSAMSPEPAATALAQAEMVPETRRLLQDSGVISFEASTVHVSAGQSLAAISVKRLPATSRAAFVWRVESGSAQPGVDYERVQPQLVRFFEGQAVRTLFIPLLNSPATLVQRASRTFTVELERVKGGPAVGRFARVTVAIDPPPTSNPVAVYQTRAGE